MIIIAVNSEECFEEYRSTHWNKKHKGMQKESCGMAFEAFVSRIMLLNEHESANKNPQKLTQKGFQAKNGVMQMTSTSSCQFASLNDK